MANYIENKLSREARLTRLIPISLACHRYTAGGWRNQAERRAEGPLPWGV